MVAFFSLKFVVVAADVAAVVVAAAAAIAAVVVAAAVTIAAAVIYDAKLCLELKSPRCKDQNQSSVQMLELKGPVA